MCVCVRSKKERREQNTFTITCVQEEQHAYIKYAPQLFAIDLVYAFLSGILWKLNDANQFHCKTQLCSVFENVLGILHYLLKLK